MKIALLGHMGRDEAVADRLVRDHELHIIGQWENPGLVDKAAASGGSYQTVDSIANVEAVADFVEDIQPDMFLTNFDDALAAGIVDELERRVADGALAQLLLPCPDRAAARIEWDKFYLRELIEEIAPEYNPKNFMATTAEEIDQAVEYFLESGGKIAVKPRGLTGGKGVKVMGKHFDTLDDGRDYAVACLEGGQPGVEIQEKITGHEFTLQLLTDGTTVIRPPTTYDYPYREDGDTGPGTGGMGVFAMHDCLMPFVDQSDYDEAVSLMEKLLALLRGKDIRYKGVLYPTFFKTNSGLKIVETNARGGDPELITITDLMTNDVDLGNVLRAIATEELEADQVTFQQSGAAMIYLVSPDYGYQKGPVLEFKMDLAAIEAAGCKVRFAAAERIEGDRYRTVGSSRSVGLSALGDTAWDARAKLHDAIKRGFGPSMPLAYRNDIADQTYIESLS